MTWFRNKVFADIIRYITVGSYKIRMGPKSSTTGAPMGREKGTQRHEKEAQARAEVEIGVMLPQAKGH